MIGIAIGGIAAALCVFLILKRSRSSTTDESSSSLPPPPGPTKSLVMGNFKDIDTKRVHKSLHKLFQKHGPVVHLRLLKRNIVILNSGEVIRKAFEDEEYNELLNDKPQGFYGTYLVYGHKDVLLGPYCERTFKLKDVMYKGLKLAMNESNITDECNRLVEILAQYGAEDFCIADAVESVLAEVFAHFITGEVKPGDVEITWDFVNWSNKMLNPSVESLLKNLPFLRLMPGKLGTLYSEAKERRDRLLKRFLDETRDSYQSGVVRCLVDTYLHVQAEDLEKNGDTWLTDDLIRAAILDTIGGGLPTTTSTILAAILNLLHNRACVEKMAKEIQTVLGKDLNPTPSVMDKLPYCQAVILETQRYSTLVPVVSHFCSKCDVDFEGYSIKKGTMVWGNIWSAHHNSDVWLDPWTFSPERFLDETGELLPNDHANMRNFLPLGVGSRYCPGSDFTMQRMFAYVTKIVQKYDILPPKNSELISNDPNQFFSGAVLHLERFPCRLTAR